MNLLDDSGISSIESVDIDIYYEQIKPILTILWRDGIRNMSDNDQMSQFFYKLAQVYLLQHYWKRSDVLINLEQALGGANVIEQNTIGENILDFYNAANTQLQPYIRDFINEKL